jgi:fibronectin-binding autotransporter adhesin
MAIRPFNSINGFSVSEAGTVVIDTTGNVTTKSVIATQYANTANLNANGTVSFTSASNVSLGNVSNVHITGGASGQILTTDGAGDLSWIDNTPTTVTYIANSCSLLNGVYVTGDLYSIQVFGDYNLPDGVFTLTDGTGVAPAWIFNVGFTSVANFNQVQMNINYTAASNHTIYVQLYNFATSYSLPSATVSTQVTTNYVTVSSTTGMYVGQTLVFGANVGGLVAGTLYYVLSVVNSTQITVGVGTGSGSIVILSNDSVTTTVQAKNYDNIGTYTGLGYYYAFALDVIDDTNYINSGVVDLRLFHSNAGNATHVTNIDYVALVLSNQGPQGPKGPTGATGAAGPGVATGGTTGQVLIKNSGANYDTSWSSSLTNLTNITASGNIQSANVTATGALSVTGNANIGNIRTGGLITATGNIATAGNISATGNLSGFDLNLANLTVSTQNRNARDYTEVSGANNHLTIIAPTGKQSSQASDTFSKLYYTSNIANVDPVSGNDDFVWAYVNNGGFLVSGNTGGSTDGGFSWSNSNDTLNANNISANTLSLSGNANVGNINATGNVSGFDLNLANLTISTQLRGFYSTAYTEIAGSNNSLTILAPTIQGAYLASDYIAGLYWTSNIANVDPNNGNDEFISVAAGAGAFSVYDNNGNNLIWSGVDDLLTANNISATGNLSVGNNISVFNGISTHTLTATSNITGGNLTTGGKLSVTGNANIGNIGTGIVTATGNITGGNISATGTINGFRITGSTLSVSGNITGGNLTTSGVLSVSGNADIGNIGTGIVTATGNITGGSLTTGGKLSVTGNANIGNIGTGIVTATGNITGGNLTTGGTANVAILSVSGNVDLGTDSGSPINIGINKLSANIIIGGNQQQGFINLGRSAFTQGIYIANGVTTSIDTKTVSIGENGAAGSITNIAIGPAAGTGTVTFNSATTIRIANTGGSALSVAGNANVGNLSTPGSGSFGANVNMNSNWINNVGYPALANDVATKSYVDTQVSSGIQYHQPVNVATTTTLAIATSGTTAYNSPNGAANGIGAYISTTGTFLNIDSFNVQTVGTRILVKDEANAAWNGVYTYANTTAIVRSTDADEYGPDSTEQLSINDYFFVQSGTVNRGNAYVVSAPAGTIIFGTSNITFSQFSTSQVYTAGTGIAITGTVISANASQTQITAVGTLTSLSVIGNANIGNIGTGVLSVSGNGTFGNINISGSGGNISGANVISANTLSATGNIVAGNVLTNNLLYANGSPWVFSGSSISNGNSNVNIATANGNVTIAAVGNTTMTITGTGANITGTLSVSSNANVGNFSTAGNAAAGNILTNNLLYANGTPWSLGGGSNISNGNSNVNIATANGNVTIAAVGNTTMTITGTGVNVAGTFSASGNANVGNLGIAGLITATGNGTFANVITSGSGGNISGANIISATTITASGNITGTNLIGPLANGNSNVSIATINGNVTIAAVGNTTMTITGTGANIAGTLSASGNTNVGNFSTAGNAAAGNVLTNNLLYANGTPWPLYSGTGTFVTRTYTGDGTTTTFTVTSGTTSSSVIVTESGVLQTPTTDYSISGTTLTFTTAPPSGVSIQIRELAVVSTTSATGAFIVNGNSQVNVNANANITVSVAGTSNTVVFTSTGVNVAGYISATGNVAAANILTNNLLYANGVAWSLGGGSNISNGTSNVTIAASGGNVTFGVGGTANVMVVASTVVSVASNVEFSGANVSLGAVANLKITGGANTNVLSTDGSGNLSWVAQTGGDILSPFLLMGA